MLRAAACMLATGLAACSGTRNHDETVPARSPTAPESRATPTAAHATHDLNWPVPTGWKHETIPFPLGFAPGLPYRGVEELRFAPNFFEASAVTYWSYVFVWWLEARPTFDAPTLSDALTEYYRGLSAAVGKDKYTFDPATFRAVLTPKLGTEIPTLAGQVFTYDAFTTGQPLVLNVEARLRECPTAGRYSILFMASPRPFEDPVWSDLRACAAAFACP